MLTALVAILISSAAAAVLAWFRDTRDAGTMPDEWVLTCPESARTALVRFDGLEPGECTLWPQYRRCGRSCVSVARKSDSGQHASTC